MSTKIICLANSKKYGDRCIAGIQVKKTKKGFSIQNEDSKPKWIRPISNSGHGEFPTSIVRLTTINDGIKS